MMNTTYLPESRGCTGLPSSHPWSMTGRSCPLADSCITAEASWSPPTTVSLFLVLLLARPFNYSLVCSPSGAAYLANTATVDIINVVSVTAAAKVDHMIEEDDNKVQEALYWRQAWDVRTHELSVCSFPSPNTWHVRTRILICLGLLLQSVDPVCKCNLAANPDCVLVGCSNIDCGKWLHDSCLAHEVLMQTWLALGSDKPHFNKPGEFVSYGPSNSSPPADEPKGVVINPSNNDTEFPPPDGTDSRTQAYVDVWNSRFHTTESPVKSGRKGRSRKKEVRQPYEGLFKAITRVKHQPSMIEIHDLRGLPTGDKSWAEKLCCLVCGEVME